ncbi:MULTISPECIES: hypothetical protein [Kamptonema]|uniref:hypothetical protein n=1 Tax=Kamptonema TaxID=1501433 RepID=UPI0001DAC807|nr:MULTISPECIES: hypothetical protein [Kamptonema]CBN55512.1 hypothetical protein OSCI_2040006 [Kamptonema sp. PCC 6506]
MAYIIHEDRDSSNENDAVEVDGVEFKVFMPKRILQVPAEQLGAMIDVELGIQITNNTSNPLNFCFFNALTPELMIDQQIFRLTGRWSDWYRWDLFDDDFSLAQPGETVTFLTDALITTAKGEIFDLKIPFGDGSYWIFCGLFGLRPLKKYRIRFQYENEIDKAEVNYSKNGRNMPKLIENKQIENIWTGKVRLPFVEFSLEKDG